MSGALRFLPPSRTVDDRIFLDPLHGVKIFQVFSPEFAAVIRRFLAMRP